MKKILLVFFMIVFLVGSVSAYYKGNFPVYFGRYSGPVCGNSIIEEGEQCDTENLGGQTCSNLISGTSGTLRCKSDCTWDASGCIVIQPPSQPSGGSPGGNGLSHTTVSTYSSNCVENWQCTGWSSCVNGKQRRTCKDSAKCGTYVLKPAESKECEEETLKLNISSEQQGFLSGITGAVIGAVGTPAGIGVLIFLIALVGIYIYALIMRKRQTSR